MQVRWTDLNHAGQMSDLSHACQMNRPKSCMHDDDYDNDYDPSPTPDDDDATITYYDHAPDIFESTVVSAFPFSHNFCVHQRCSNVLMFTYFLKKKPKRTANLRFLNQCEDSRPPSKR